MSPSTWRRKRSRSTATASSPPAFPAPKSPITTTPNGASAMSCTRASSCAASTSRILTGSCSSSPAGCARSPRPTSPTRRPRLRRRPRTPTWPPSPSCPPPLPGRPGSEPVRAPIERSRPIQNMPRLRQVPKDEATAPIVTTMYEWLFEGRDPVAEPRRWDGTTGDWWTVFALVPEILDHAVKGFGLYQSPTRLLPPELRELGQIRTGWAAASQFVFSQHAKSMRELGMPEEKITSIPSWPVASCYDDAERAVLAYTDCLVYDLGRVPDAIFAELRRHLSDE